MSSTITRAIAFLRVCLDVVLIVVFSILVADVVWGVVTRYAFGEQARWSEELARLLTVWLALLGAARAQYDHEHLGIDLLTRKLHPDARWLAYYTSHVSIIHFSAIVMVWGGGCLVVDRFESGQTLPALGILKAWSYVAIPVSGMLITIFSLSQLGRADPNATDSEQGPVDG